MDDKTTSTQSEQTMKHVPDPTVERAVEHRESYGTAKTENLRDSGIWRIILPAFVIACCLLLIAIPLVILVPLLIESLDPHSPDAGYNFMWIWITLIVVALGMAAVIVRGLSKIFLTQAGNYHKL